MPYRITDLPDRIAAKIEPDENGCWLWTAATIVGYGTTSLKRRSYRAHRFTYELLVGPIPDGLQIDHLCRVRACVNPEHLEPVTAQENIRRGKTGEPNALKTHCPRGHPYDEKNTYDQGGGRRACRKCKALRELAARKKEQ